MDIENKTLETLTKESHQAVDYYNKILQSLYINRIDKKIIQNYYGQSLNYIFHKIEEQYNELTSNYLFPGNQIFFYPQIKETHARKITTCNFSGALIYPGSLYINYKFFLENLTTKEIYVLKKPLKVELGYRDDLPTTIQALDDFAFKLSIGEENMSHLSQTLDYTLSLQKINK